MIERVGERLRRVVSGYFQYCAVHGDGAVSGRFRFLPAGIRRMKTVRRRSQKARMAWDKFKPIIDCWLPKPITRRPCPNQRYNARPQ